MKKRIGLLLVCLLLSLFVNAAFVNRTITVTTEEGVTMHLFIANSSQKTASVSNSKKNESSVIDTNTKGKVTIPSKVNYSSVDYTIVSIAPYAFKDCTGITEVVIPNSITSVGNSVFSGCI